MIAKKQFLNEKERLLNEKERLLAKEVLEGFKILFKKYELNIESEMDEINIIRYHVINHLTYRALYILAGLDFEDVYKLQEESDKIKHKVNFEKYDHVRNAILDFYKKGGLNMNNMDFYLTFM